MSRLPVGALVILLALVSASVTAQGNPERGQYLARAAGCVGCHTESTKGSVPFAGGRALKTPFGTFYGPNITPHPESGIGRWSEADFIRAIRFGERPDGAHYFPAFPYPSFKKISDSDLRDLWAFLRTLPPSDRANQPHDLRFPFSLRFLVAPWKWLYFTPGPMAQNNERTPAVNRGAYLSEALGHCGECHTPRNALGGPRADRLLAGGKGPEGKRIPNVTPTRLKGWSDAELKEFFLSGLTPEGDSANATMDEVIQNTTSKLTPGDLAALMAYLRALPPLPDEPRE